MFNCLPLQLAQVQICKIIWGFISLRLRLKTINILYLYLGGGRNVDDQNVDRPKISERRNGLFS